MESVLLGFAILTLVNCSRKEENLPNITQDKKQLYEKAGWLIGSWERNGENAQLSSVWRHENDSTYSKTSTLTSGLGKVIADDTHIEERNGRIAMISKVGDKEISFALISSRPDELQFESTDPAYVERTILRNHHGDSISETHYQNGSREGQRFVYVRHRQ